MLGARPSSGKLDQANASLGIRCMVLVLVGNAGHGLALISITQADVTHLPCSVSFDLNLVTPASSTISAKLGRGHPDPLAESGLR